MIGSKQPKLGLPLKTNFLTQGDPTDPKKKRQQNSTRHNTFSRVISEPG
jgi:hypothetical protein